MGYLLDTFTKRESGFGRSFDKHPCYAEVYEEWLAPFKDKDVVLVEIGIGWGGSLQVWKHFLGPKAKIYGLDIQEGSFYTEDQIVGNYRVDQLDIESLEKVPIPEIDIFIDDASHISKGQINTFKVFFPRLRSNGLYIVEDIGTSYRFENYGGGFRKQGSFIEYCKDIIDVLQINEWGAIIPQAENMKSVVGHLIPIYDNILFGKVKSVTFYVGQVIIKKG